MGPILSARPGVQTLGTSPHPSAGHPAMKGAAALNGARAEPAAPVAIARAVAPASGAERAVGLEGEAWRIEAAKARAEAAERAYRMASLAAGVTPGRETAG